MSRHRKEIRQAADATTKNRFAIVFGISVVVIMALVVVAAGLMN